MIPRACCICLSVPRVVLRGRGRASPFARERPVEQLDFVPVGAVHCQYGHRAINEKAS